MAKKKRGPPADDAAGAPAWVMTFADLMSLLMCFFVLLLSFSEMDAAKYKQVAGSMKFAFGVQREVKTLESPKGVSIIAKEFTPGKPQPTLEKVLRQKTTDDNRAYLELLRRDALEKLLNEGVIGGPKTGKTDDKGKGKGPGKGKGDDSGKGLAKGEESGKDMQKGQGSETGMPEDDDSKGKKGPDGESAENPASMLAKAQADGMEGKKTGTGAAGSQGAEAGGQGNDGKEVEPGTISARQTARIQATMLSIALEEEIDEGLLEVETMDEGVLVRVREQGSFPSGTADMSKAFLPVLHKIAGALVNPESKLVVSGHTDNRPISTRRYPSNWMLSAARATSVVQALAQKGNIAQERLEVRAHADTVPVEANDTRVGRARNRRVEIFIGTPTEPATATPATAEAVRQEKAT